MCYSMRKANEGGITVALMNCPECQKEISDQAPACPNCGMPVKIRAKEIAPQQVEITGLKIPSRRKKLILFSLLGILVIGIGILGTKYIIDRRAEDEARQLSLILREEYVDTLVSFRIFVILGVSDAEHICNLTKTVWNNTIQKKRDPDTDLFTRTNGRFNENFNISLARLYSDDATLERINRIKKNQEIVSELYKKLQNPPDEMQQVFERTDELFDVYISYTNLAINPAGTLQSYSQKASELVDEFMDKYNKQELFIPEK